jgi:uncharacterized protein YbaR (Trm112 family)
MIDPEFLAMLVCPASREPLRQASAAELARANAAIGAGAVQNRGGARVEAPLQAALATADGKWLYPIVDGIPILLVGEAVPLPT